MHFKVRIFAEPVDIDQAAISQPHGLQGLARFGAPIASSFPSCPDGRSHLLR
jgi:hypothetical protein